MDLVVCHSLMFLINHTKYTYIASLCLKSFVLVPLSWLLATIFIKNKINSYLKVAYLNMKYDKFQIE